MFKVRAWAILGAAQLSWVSPMCTGGGHAIKLLFVFLLLVCFLLHRGGVSAKNLEQQTENDFSSSMFFLAVFPIWYLSYEICVYHVAIHIYSVSYTAPEFYINY